MSAGSQSWSGLAAERQGETSSPNAQDLKNVLKANASFSPCPQTTFFLQLFQLIEAIIRTGKLNAKVKSARHQFAGNTLQVSMGLCALNVDYSFFPFHRTTLEIKKSAPGQVLFTQIAYKEAHNK